MKLAEGDYAVLGFLLLAPMTGYQLKAMMDVTVGQFHRASYGGIYPSLKKLTRAGYLSMTQSVSGGKVRKTYRPRPAGRKAFAAWLKEPPEITRGPGPLLTRMFFLGLGGRATARAFTRAVRRSARERTAWLKRVAEEYRGRADAYQMATAQFGIEYYGFLDRWFTRLEAGL
ncbi:MAG: PadR family transcriptional regulator [Anaerolineales bacterium]|nr:PadR family transcriptional regulator [Anaerolineales bacterium]